VKPPARLAHWPLPRLEALILIGSLVCALVVVAATVSHVLQMRRAIQGDAQARLTTVSRILAKEINRSLTQTRGLLDQVEEALDKPELEWVLEGLPRQQFLLREIAVVGPDGRVVASSNRRSVGRDVSGYDFAQSPRSRNLFVGLPKAGRSVAAGDAIEGPAHALSGFVTLSRSAAGRATDLRIVAVLGADSLINDLRFLSPDEDSVFSLYRYDGRLLATSDPAVAARTEPHPIFTSFLPDRESGAFTDRAGDARAWLAHFGTTADFPVVVEARLPQSVVTARWQSELVAPAAIVVVTVLLLALYARMTAGAIRMRIRSQELAATQERRLRNILDTAADGIVTIDGRGIVREYNRAAESIFGVPAAEAIGQPLSAVLPPEHAQAHQSSVERCLAAGSSDVIGRGRTILSVRRDGRPVELNLAISEVIDQGEHLFTGIVRDVTEMRQAEQRFRTLFQRSGEPHLLFDATGLIDCNDAALLLLRANVRDELMGRGLASLAPAMQGDTPSAEVLDAATADARRDGVRRLVWTARAVGGELFPVEMTLTPIRLGEHEAMLVAWHDIAERQRYENDLKLARDAAESAAATKAQFLAMMSHELRTPMAGIIGMIDLLRDSSLSDEQRRFAEVLRNSAQSLLTVLNDVLDYSKIEAGKLEIEHIDFQPAAVAREVIDLLSNAASERGNNLRADWSEDRMPALRGDPTRIRQVLFNLVGNAIKFTERGTITLAIDTAPAADGRTALRFEVRDTGVGIAADVMPTLFRPFQQADSSTTRRFGGTGLGLAICRHLVVAMEGSIEVESRPGEGSIFRFEVPLEAASGAPSPPAPATAPAPAVRGLRLLVAEDNPTNRLLIATRLRRAGHLVELVDDGVQALEAARSGDYHVILMDMQMPELDGVGATRAIRALPGVRGRVPIVALSADALPEFRSRYMASGLDDFLTKPIDWPSLDRVLVRYAPQGPRAREQAGAADDAARPVGTAPGAATTGAPAGAAGGARDPIDASAVAAMRDDLGEDVWDVVAEVFWPKADIDLAACRQALADGDARALRGAAHSLKGASSSLGFDSVAGAAALLENGEPADAPAAVDRLDAVLATTRADWGQAVVVSAGEPG
jgi:PAS domain S-box-containing protein